MVRKIIVLIIFGTQIPTRIPIAAGLVTMSSVVPQVVVQVPSSHDAHGAPTSSTAVLANAGESDSYHLAKQDENKKEKICIVLGSLCHTWSFFSPIFFCTEGL